MRLQDPYAHYKIGQELGSGKFGNVCLASCLRTGKEFAIKTIAKHQPDFDIRLVRREVEILNIVSAHPNIAGLHEVPYTLHEEPVHCRRLTKMAVHGFDTWLEYSQRSRRHAVQSQSSMNGSLSVP